MINADVIAKQYSLPLAVAREIVAEETSLVLRRKWQLWAVFLVVVALGLFAWFVLPAGSRLAVVLGLSGCVLAWHALGKYYSTSAIHAAAKAKAERLQGLHS